MKDPLIYKKILVIYLIKISITISVNILLELKENLTKFFCSFYKSFRKYILKIPCVIMRECPSSVFYAVFLSKKKKSIGRICPSVFLQAYPLGYYFYFCHLLKYIFESFDSFFCTFHKRPSEGSIFSIHSIEKISRYFLKKSL